MKENNELECEQTPLTNEQIEYMVYRFLMWRLPEPWSPDGGISYSPPTYANATIPKYWPVGTNLFDADQAREMVEYMVKDMPKHEKENPAPQFAQEMIENLRRNVAEDKRRRKNKVVNEKI